MRNDLKYIWKVRVRYLNKNMASSRDGRNLLLSRYGIDGDNINSNINRLNEILFACRCF